MGTPCSTVTLASAMSARARAGSKDGCNTIVAPRAIVPSMTPKPKMAKNGPAPSTRSSGEISRSSATRTAFSTSARCDSGTPLGLPIVPDVYMTARSAVSSYTAGRGTGRPAPLETRSSNWKIRSSYHKSSSPTVTTYCRSGKSPSNSSKRCRKSTPSHFSMVTTALASACRSW